MTNGNDTTAGGDIAFLVGNSSYGRGDYFTADHDTVHNVGDMQTAQDMQQSWGGFYEHAFYMEATSHWQITNCVIYGVSGRAIQLYTDAQDGYAANNLISDAGTGIIFDGTSSNNVFTRNIVVGSFFLGAVVRGSSFHGSGNTGRRQLPGVQPGGLLRGAGERDRGVRRPPTATPASSTQRLTSSSW